MRDAAVRLGYLAETVRLLYPGPGSPRAYTLLPHAAVPRRLAPRRWWHLGSRVVVPVEGSIAAHLSDVFHRPVETVLHVRPALRANRKPILEARSGGRRLAFVKIGDSARARALITAEAAALRRLAGLSLETVTAPAVLHHGDWRGLSVLALSPLPVPGRLRRRPVPGPLLMDAVREIAGTGGARPAWHGDLAPWNLCRSRDGRLLVWDWERYEIGVPLGFDAVHHFFQRALRRMAPPVAARACVARSVRLLAPLGVSSAAARQTALRYLIALAGRHAADGHAPLGPPESWLNPAVDHEELLL
ncbi:hypothetical protein [Nonomuraea gerenzanensis]|uniref:Aminoglycoside phosphotransferase domain-containing protein n=1 Tax=Nonomuraea gerenzanensis TaxID=93944 RepID=A0A1M4EQ73_9ACTN|nr:hypothetical protein [Nonomuraea gerenzanensis]UBU12418.1 hypothetical protein LCN96_50470 [Nonomuraea gerenzanensis]SBP00969.1 hypothetical protein BN4615_P10485 [Nonomuraea gerenzanensis]